MRGIHKTAVHGLCMCVWQVAQLLDHGSTRSAEVAEEIAEIDARARQARRREPEPTGAHGWQLC